MDGLLCFVAVEFPDDPNVAGLKYWYYSPNKNVEIGDGVIAPLGRHNNCQRGVVREVRFAPEYEAPYPIYLIKSIQKIIKAKQE